jgi:PST family polysaccharide transporter
VSLALQTVRGAIWTISAGIGSRALGLIGTLVVTRFVTPAEYGEVTVAAVLAMTANQISTLGVGQFIVARPQSGREVAFHATAIHIFSGVAALGVLLTVGGALGPWLGAPHVEAFLPGLALGTLIDRIGFVPERVLVRDLRFGVLSAGRTAGDIGYTVASVGLAMLGWGAMAIVAGNVARAVLRTGIFVGAVERRDWIDACAPSLQTARELFGFGLPLSVAALSAFASRRWDNLLVSSFFGPGPTGLYNLAYNLADVPAIQVGEQVGDVLLPSFARMDRERRRRALLRSLTLLGLVVFPLAIGLGVVAPTLVELVFDPRWHAVAPMLLLLSALSVARPVGWTIASYLQARQLPRHVMLLELFKLAALLGAVATLGRMGPLWTCAAVGIAFAVHTLASLWVVQRVDEAPLSSSLASLGPPLLACAPLALAVLGARWALGGIANVSTAAALVLETLAGAIAYIVAAWFVAREPLQDLLARVAEALGRRPVVESA